MTNRITKIDVEHALALLNKHAGDCAAWYYAHRDTNGGTGWTITRRGKGERTHACVSFVLTTRDAYLLLRGILHGRKHQQADHEAAVSGTTPKTTTCDSHT